MAIADILRGCPLFFELEDREIEAITRHCRVFACLSGQRVLEQGHELQALYIVLEGEFSAERQDYPPGAPPLRVLLAGDPFGETYLVGELRTPESLIAKSESVLLEIQYQEIFALHRKEPALFGLLMLNLSRLLARRLATLELRGSPLKAAA